MTEIELIQKIKTELAKSLAKRQHGFRTMQVGTVDQNGLPQVRSVVFRDYNFERGELVFHTDNRSGKVSQMFHNSNLALHMWDERSKLQLRWSGIATLHQEGEMFESHWKKSTPGSLKVYLAESAPGTKSEVASHNLPNRVLKKKELTKDEVEPGKANFCVVQVAAHSLEILHLGKAGHLRALLTQVDSQWSLSWIEP
ncbi:MAG: pyridoxamine 5'-phosphate oxidase family protein [Bdellovibrionales bacterium]|nr:pyridoxamine 5'-phosphate oxidase family protein [Bdellovibrionales bacterium]